MLSQTLQPLRALARSIAPIALLLSCFLPAATADDFPAVQLFTADSLIGWDDGTDAGQGWQMRSGKLTGSDGSRPLLSGWTFGDFEFRFTCKLGDGVLKLTLPVVPPVADRIPDPYIAQQYWLVLSQRAGGELYHADRLLARSKQPPAKRDGYSVLLRRRRDELSLSIDNEPQFTAKVASARVGLSLSVPEGRAEIGDLTAAEPAGQSIFNGRDLAGWNTGDPPGAWIVKEGDLVCTGAGRDYLRLDELQENFVLSLEYNLSRRGNSGIGIRTPLGGWPSGDGIELQLYDEANSALLTRHSTMALYGNLEPLIRADRPANWNQAVVKVEGYLVSGWINGALVQHANTLCMPELKHRHLSGWIGLQNHHSLIRFRNLRLQKIVAGRGLPDWYGPRAESGSALVLDRLLNSERLSRPDPIRAATIVRRVSEPGMTTLAELTGPAAVVQVAAIGQKASLADGEVAFYFDQDSQPRIRCPLRDLARHVPPISEGGLPVVTFLGFQQRLRITLEAKAAGEYRVDFVKLPPDLPVETFSDREKSVARGYLPAISYRLDQMDSGRLREFDAAAKLTSPPRTIEAGASVELLNVPGAGIVEWWKLLASPAVLKDDYLKISITVDGEARPAIQAPARLLFPGLADGRSWYNFVLSNTDEPTNRLAMPFSRGIKISATNSGPSPMAAVGCAASVLPDAPDAPVANRGRLRGTLLDSNAKQRDLVKLAGTGRWVALIGDIAAGNDQPLELAIDGQIQPDCQQSLACFLGVAPGDDSRKILCGRSGSLAWRYLLPDPIDFQQSLELRAMGGPVAGHWLALYYAQ